MDESRIVIGVAWYRPEEYGILRALATDSDAMAETYDKWLAGVKNTMNELRRRGMIARRVDVEVRELVAWCEARGIPRRRGTLGLRRGKGKRG
jgi:hypothetical protein